MDPEVRRIRDALREIVRGKNLNVAPKTAEQYKARVNRWTAAKCPPLEAWLEGKTAQTVKAYRSACVYSLRILIRQVLAKRDEFEKSGNLEEADSLMRESEFLISLHSSVAQVKPTPSGPKRRAKKPWLPKTPDWRERMLHAAPKRFKEAVAILTLTGARPAELAEGVTIRHSREHATLTFTVLGKKVDASGKDGARGQPTRWVTVQAFASDAARYLVAKLGAREDYTFKLSTSPKALTEGVRRLSRKLWPRSKRRVCPYSFRHQLAADMKRGDVDREEFAAAMGHASTSTSKTYGSWSQGSAAGRPIIHASAERPIRTPSREPRPGLRL